jgi:hypothetical protein
LKRDHFDRASMQDMIQTMSFAEIESSLEFLENRIIDPLVRYTDTYFSNVISHSKGVIKDQIVCQRKPIKRQLRARIRLRWIGELFRKQIALLNRDVLFPLDRAVVRKMYQILDRRRLDPFSKYGYELFQTETTLAEMYMSDRYEEMLLQVSHEYGLFHAYEPQIWCEVARNLTRDLVRKLTEVQLQAINPRKINQKKLAETIYRISNSAATSIRFCCSVLSSPHSSQQQVTEACKLLGFVGTENNIITSHLLSSSSTSSKKSNICLLETGISTGKSEYQIALPNSLDLMCPSLAPQSNNGTKRKQLQLSLRCRRKGGNCNVLNCIEALRSGKAKIDEEWYLLWQVVRVVHNILSIHCLNTSSSSDHYSVEKICRSVGVDIEAAEIMLAVRMAEPHREMYHETETII